MLINTKLCFPLKSQFEILLPAENEILKLPVKVSRLLKKDNIYEGIGVELLAPSPKYLEFLDKQFRNLSIRGNKTKTFVCSVCKHIAFGQAPANCPFCYSYSPIDNFHDNSGEVNYPTDFQSFIEFKKKHFPLINIMRESASAHDINVRVTVGEIQHETDVDDHIRFIDFYFNDFGVHKNCIARVNLNCRKIVPETSLDFHEMSSGILTVNK